MTPCLCNACICVLAFFFPFFIHLIFFSILYSMIFERWYFDLCWNLRLVIIELWFYLEGFGGFLLEDLFFEDYILAWCNIWIFIILALPSSDTFQNVNGKATVWELFSLKSLGWLMNFSSIFHATR
jgi:hypothetical protein